MLLQKLEHGDRVDLLEDLAYNTAQRNYLSTARDNVQEKIDCINFSLRPNVLPINAFADQPPTDLAVKPGDGVVTLSWNAPIYNDNDRVEQYAISYSDDGGETWLGQRHNSLFTIATIDGLQNGVSYDFRVQAKSTLGVGPWSEIVSATPFAE